MEVYKKEMYHFHKVNKYPELWEEGNTINNTKDFASNYTNYGNNANFMIELNDEMIPFYELIDYYREHKTDDDTKDLLFQLSKEYIIKLLINQREHALEEVRRQYYPNIISRREAIWVCDEPQLIHWKKSLPPNTELIKVEITGSMFITSDEFLPKLGISYNESLEEAHKYWNPHLKKCSDEQLEYLVKGKIKVLKKLER